VSNDSYIEGTFTGLCQNPGHAIHSHYDAMNNYTAPRFYCLFSELLHWLKRSITN